MKRWMIYCLVLAVMLVMRPEQMKDISELLPVELLYIYKESGQVCIKTDTGEMSAGISLASALENLKDTAPGAIFLDTADYLMVTRSTVDLLPDLTEVLRPATEVCYGWGIEETTVSFLQTHRPKVSLKDIRSGEKIIPVLIQKGGRCYYAESRFDPETT